MNLTTVATVLTRDGCTVGKRCEGIHEQEK